MITEIMVLLVLVLINGLFSGAEIATVTMRKTRIDQLLHDGSKRARAVAKLRANPERFLATVQIGITVVGAGAAAYSGDILAQRFTPVLQPVLGSYAHTVSLVVVVAIVSYLSLVIGELVPKSLALRATEPYALFVARPLLALAWLGRPIVWFLTLSSNVVLRLFGDSTSFTEARISSEELKAMLDDASQAGDLHPRAGEMASRALAFSELTAHDVMLPRRRIEALARTATLDELRALIRQSSHSRFPVYDDDIDTITGQVLVRDVFAFGAANTTIANLVKPVVFVADAMRAVDVLHELQAQASELAIVVDEHGSTVGLLTREDLAEELLGEQPSRSRTQKTTTDSDGTHLVAGDSLVRELNRDLLVRLPESDEWTTVGGLVIATLGRLPTRGESVTIANVGTIDVVDASNRRIRLVRIKPAPPIDDDD